jgi:NADH-quinone oxidoreductase subunit M
MFPILLMLIPLLTALVVCLLPSRSARAVSFAGSLGSLALAVISWCVLRTDGANIQLSYSHGWLYSLGSKCSFAIDGISMILVLLTNLLLPFIIWSTYNREIKKPKAYLSLMLFMQSALLGVFMATDGLVFYVFWELALIPIYFICLVWGGEGRQRITLKFFIYTLFGSLFMLIGFIMLYQNTPDHSFSMQSLYAAGKAMSFTQQCWVFWLIFLAFAVKMPIFPLHTWQPDTYVNAPTQGTMLLSGIMLKMGTYGLIRWLLPLAPAAVDYFSSTVIVLSVISIIYTSCIAIVQTDFKRLIAYSSIAHVGLICAGIFSYKAEGVQGALLQMFAHGINVVGLFYICDIIGVKTGSTDIRDLGGIRSVNSKFALLYLLIVLGSVALPLTNGFVGEFLMLNGLFQYNVWFAAFAGLTVILGAVYMLRSYQAIMLGPELNTTANFGALKRNEYMMLGMICVLVFVLGVYPKLLTDISAGEVVKFVGRMY